MNILPWYRYRLAVAAHVQSRQRLIGTVLLFSLLDPVDLRFVGPLELSAAPTT